MGDPDDHELITDAGSLDAFIEHAVAAPAYALDTEFHRERTYYPALALIQTRVEAYAISFDRRSQ